MVAGGLIYCNFWGILMFAMQDDCVFCKIVSGEIDAHKIWENDDFVAFLNINPIKEGHTLVIPKKHVPDVFDMEDQHLSQLMIASKGVAKMLKKTLKPKTGRVAMKVEGLEIPHAHVHLITLDNEGDLQISASKDVTNNELKVLKDRIKADV